MLPMSIMSLSLFFLKDKDSGVGDTVKVIAAGRKRPPNTLQGRGEEGQSVNMHTAWLSGA